MRKISPVQLLIVGIVVVFGNSKLRGDPPDSVSLRKNASRRVLIDDFELNFLADEVDRNFCDASSPLSLAGYMNGKFNSS